MHSCNDRFKANEARTFWQLLRWRSSGVCPPATANLVAMIRTPARMPGAVLATMFALMLAYHLHLPIICPAWRAITFRHF